MATMSRLARLEEKRNLRKATLIGIGTIVLVVILAVVGIPALVRMVVFIGDTKTGGKTVDKNDVIPPSPPRLFTSWEATNSAVLTLEGLSEPNAKIFLTQDTISKGNLTTDDGGNFKFENLVLNEGNNKFVAVAVDEAGNQSMASKELVVFYTTKQPKLEIETPTEGENISSRENKIDIKGVTDADTRLTVNDRVIIMGADGKFSYKYPLSEGENTLVFVVTDRAGNQSKKEIKVTYSR